MHWEWNISSNFRPSYSDVGNGACDAADEETRGRYLLGFLSLWYVEEPPAFKAVHDELFTLSR